MIRLVLPFPPSVNNLFVNAGKRRAKSTPYKVWLKTATDSLWEQPHKKPITGPVVVTIVVEDKGLGDLDNKIKPLLDFCVHHRLIADDSRDIVRGISARWGDVTGALIRIDSLADRAAE